MATSSSTRPEQIIASVYARARELRSSGIEPKRVVMPRRYYQAVQAYRATLGELANPELDYLGKYELFGLPIFVDEGDAFYVE